MNCERILKLLVRNYNVITKHNHFSSRWLDVLGTMIEKGKGNRTKKLRVMQKIEVYLQLLMTIFLGLRIAKDYENYNRMSKHNYGPRKGHSIESASLEKRLILDLAKNPEEPFACTMSDLEDIGGIVEESIGANREEMKLITKVLPRCKTYVRTTHGISKESYGGMNTLLGGAVQGNFFLGNVCRDVSCFMFK